MSERRQSPEKKKLPTLQESLGLQTYEFFKGGEARASKIEEFKADRSLELELDYPLLDGEIIDQHLHNLEQAIDSFVREGSLTPEYRLAEAYLLKLALDITQSTPTQAQIDRFELINREIYGRSDPVLYERTLKAAWGRITPAINSANEQYAREIEEGFTFTTESGEEIDIPALTRPGNEVESMPTLSDEALSWLEEKLSTLLEPAKQVIEEYASRKEESEFSPEELEEIFVEAMRAMGLDDIKVVVDKDASVLSWSSERGAVVIGLQRKPIKDKDQLLGLFVHEVFVHGLRFAKGREKDDDSLANGLFTYADEDKNEGPSYLVFEEGLATTLQKAVTGKKEDWSIAALGNYINISLAQEGWGPRQIYEVMYRVRLIVTTKKKKEITQADIDKAKANTLAQVVRTFRGTPSHHSYRTTDGVVLHYSKDLSYLSGKVRAIEYFNKVVQLPEGERDEVWKQLFAGKFDPTNEYQADYVRKVVEGV